jgi:pimeloyl-ACP methyl ester carboxylesterase
MFRPDDGGAWFSCYARAGCLGWGMAIVNVNGIDLYYEVHGNGASILGIHGTPSSVLLWVDAAGELAGFGRCIIYERRGFRAARFPSRSTVSI